MEYVDDYGWLKWEILSYPLYDRGQVRLPAPIIPYERVSPALWDYDNQEFWLQ
jgi:hypothetical protein